MRIDLSGKIAIVTGAGAGLGRAHAIALAERGARVLVNDLNPGDAENTAEAIRRLGSEANVHSADVADVEQVNAMVALAIESWGQVDILVNNAGILRDRTFAKMDLDDFRRVIEVHLLGAAYCTRSVWNGMKDRRFGRVIFTTSSSGLYGNFGQSNYAAAKMGLVGLMKTLALEGVSHGIHVNCLAPSAATAMTNALYPDAALGGLGADLVSPAIVALAANDAPTGKVVLAGAGSFEMAHVTMTEGICLKPSATAADELLLRFDEAEDRSREILPRDGGEQYRHEVQRALAAGL